MWKALVEKLREKSVEGRKLNYLDGAVGISALLQCPLKYHLQKTYDIAVQSVEIDDGFVWERQVKTALMELFPGKVQEEKDLVYEVDGFLIHGHLDVMVEDEKEITAIELKAPRFIQLKAMPKKVEGGLYVDEEGLVLHNPMYLNQAKVQKFILERLYPNKKVHHYIFYKGLARYGNFNMKLYIVSPVKESVQEEELKELVKDFKEKKAPKYPNECEYCIFYKEGLCPGGEPKEVKEEKLDLFMDYLREYRRLQSEMKTVESYLKKLIRGSVRLNGKEIGWVKREVKELDINKLLQKLENPEEYFMVKWQKKDELINKFGEEIIKSKKSVIEWKI